MRQVEEASHQVVENINGFVFDSFFFFLFFSFVLTKDLSILLIKDHEHKIFTSQSIKALTLIVNDMRKQFYD
jgi:hypothetical protein